MTTRATTPASIAGLSPPSEIAGDHTRLRVAINPLTEDPRNPPGAHWCWTRMVPEMSDRLLPGEELHPMLSPTARRGHPGRAAVLADPHDRASLARAILDDSGTGADAVRIKGLRRAQQFTWGATAEATLDVYREVAERRRQRR